MDWNSFNSIAIRNESADAIEFDLRPFSEQQNEAFEFLLDEMLTQADPFGKFISVKTDASVVLSTKVYANIGKLKEKRVLVHVVRGS